MRRRPHSPGPIPRTVAQVASRLQGSEPSSVRRPAESYPRALLQSRARRKERCSPGSMPALLRSRSGWMVREVSVVVLMVIRPVKFAASHRSVTRRADRSPTPSVLHCMIANSRHWQENDRKNGMNENDAVPARRIPCECLSRRPHRSGRHAESTSSPRRWSQSSGTPPRCRCTRRSPPATASDSQRPGRVVSWTDPPPGNGPERRCEAVGAVRSASLHPPNREAVRRPSSRLEEWRVPANDFAGRFTAPRPLLRSPGPRGDLVRQRAVSGSPARNSEPAGSSPRRRAPSPRECSRTRAVLA